MNLNKILKNTFLVILACFVLSACATQKKVTMEGQMQGGAAQGIGWALNEEYFMSDDGIMMNSSLLDYRMPTSLDLPMIETLVVEVPNPLHPYGVRGVGEVPIVPPLAAIANAIYHATGVRMTELPMNPSSVASAIKAYESSPK